MAESENLKANLIQFKQGLKQMGELDPKIITIFGLLVGIVNVFANSFLIALFILFVFGWATRNIYYYQQLGVKKAKVIDVLLNQNEQK
jgi:hypothetical protein